MPFFNAPVTYETGVGLMANGVPIDDGALVLIAASAGSSAAASANTASLQSALNAGGYVSITVPGVYFINQVLSIPSNTTIYIGAGVELKVADNANCGIFTNVAARAAGTVLTAGALVWTDAGPNYAATITQANLNLLYPVGSFIGVMGTPDRGFQGVWEVVAAGASLIKFRLADGVGGSGVAASGTGTTQLTIYPADLNIRVFGPGRLNGNGANQTLYGAGDPRGCVTWFRNAKNVTLEGFECKRGITWTCGSNNLVNYTVTGLTGDTRGGLTGDFVHMSGQHRQALIEKLNVASGDNIVGMTMDITAGTAYDFPYQQPGDMYDVTIRNIHGITPTTAIIGIYGPAAYRFHSLVIDGISGQGTSAVQFSTYAPTAMNNCNGGSARISKITALTSGASVQGLGTQNWDNIVIDDVVLKSPSQEAVLLTAAGTIKKLTVRNAMTDTLYGSRTGPMVSISSTNVTALLVKEIENEVLTGTVALISKTGTGNIGKVRIEDVDATGPATVAAVWRNSGAGTVPGVIQYTGSSYNATAL